jgi:hypothetical protein
MITYKKSGVTVTEMFFDSKPAPQGADIVRYHNFSQPVPGTHSYEYPTIRIDLKPEPSEILAQMRRRARRKLKSAEAATLVHEYNFPANEQWTAEFLDFFDRFAPLKHLPAANRSRIGALQSHSVLLLSRVRDASGEVLVWHAYYVKNKVARLFHSASLFRAHRDTDGAIDREFADRVADANAFLHWNDMLTARTLGCDTYDWGGWHAGNDPENLRINEFKEGFGGAVVPQFFADEAVSLKGYVAIRARQVQGVLRGNR